MTGLSLEEAGNDQIEKFYPMCLSFRDLSGRIFALGTGLLLKWSGDSDQQLYAISERGGLLRTNRVVTTYGLPHRPWDIRQTMVTLSIDTMPTLLITTAV